MEVVCLILVTMFISQPCSHVFLGFDVPTSYFIFIKNVFFLNGINILFIIYELIIILYFTLSGVLQEVVSVTVSNIQYCNANHSI